MQTSPGQWKGMSCTESQTGEIYRLPWEAEREYAARAGTKTPFWWGTSISTGQANYIQGARRASTGQRRCR